MMSTRATDANRPEQKVSVWSLTLAPATWSLHFLISYITAAVHCAKFSGDADAFLTVRWLVGAYTLVALMLISVIGVVGYRRHRQGNGRTPHDFDSPEDQRRFLGFATLLLSLLSGVATIFVAMVFVIIRNCD